MFRLLNIYTKKRLFWLLLALVCLGVLAISLYIQYYYFFPPCVLCVYQRIAITAIFFSSLISMFCPKSTIIRCITISIWIFSAAKGLQLALKQNSPDILTPCPLTIDYPTWLPLDIWLPQLYFPQPGGCISNEIFLFFTIPEWLIGLFAGYLMIGILFFVMLFVKEKNGRQG